MSGQVAHATPDRRLRRTRIFKSDADKASAKLFLIFFFIIIPSLVSCITHTILIHSYDFKFLKSDKQYRHITSMTGCCIMHKIMNQL